MIPKPLRDQLGLLAGEVELTVDGAALRIEPISGEGFVEEHGRLVVPAQGTPIDDALVQLLRDAGQR